MNMLSLSDIVTEITDQFTDLHGVSDDNLSRRIRVGELLVQAQLQVVHGEWIPWVRDNLPFGERQARKYMYVYVHRIRAIEEAKRDPQFPFIGLNHMIAILRDSPAKPKKKKKRREKPNIKLMDPVNPEASAVNVYMNQCLRDPEWTQVFMDVLIRLIQEQPSIDDEIASVNFDYNNERYKELYV